MIRVKISNFIKEHKGKLQDVFTKLIMVAIVVFIATIILSSSQNIQEIKDDEAERDFYKPTKTVLKGADISEKQYKEDVNTVEKFLESCNKGEIKETYLMLSDECKKELYPTLEDFEKYYYTKTFDKKREYNLQAWISTSKYTVYKIRYTNSMLSTGTYDENDVYQDYITLNKNSDKNTISLGNFVYSEDCNIKTKDNDIEVLITKKNIYLTYEEYEMQIKNNSDKTILLDDLETGRSIRLIANGIQYFTNVNKLFLTNLTINPNSSKNLTIRFNKSLNSNNSSQRIEFLKVINDYDSYKQDKENYIDTRTVKIKVED